MKIYWLITALIGSLIFGFACGGRASLSFKNWACQLQNADPNAIVSSGFELVVIDYSRDGSEQGEYSSQEINLIRSAGVVPVSYISVGEAEDYRFYWQDEWYSDPPDWLGEENPNWPGNYAVKYWEEGWKRIVFSYLDRIISQGFAGVYLDKVDEFEYWAEEIGIEESARRMINFVLEIVDYCRRKAGSDFLVFLQNGEELLDFDDGSLLRAISGWAVEDLFYNGLEQVPSEISEKRIKYLDLVKGAGKVVLSIDYVDDGGGYWGENKARIDDYRWKALNKGYIPYVARSDRELDELNVIEGVQP